MLSFEPAMKRIFPSVPSLALLLGVVAPGLLGAFAAGCSKTTDESTSAGVSAIVFIKRQHTVVGDNGQVVRTSHRDGPD